MILIHLMIKDEQYYLLLNYKRTINYRQVCFVLPNFNHYLLNYPLFKNLLLNDIVLELTGFIIIGKK